MKQDTSFLKKLLRDEGGAILIIVTVYLPVIVGFFSMAVDMSYALRSRNMLQVAAEAAALAATAKLPDPVTSCAQAQIYANNNISNSSYYGNVLSTCADVVLGKWPQGCAAYTDCFSALPAGQDCIAFQCNAARVTTRMTTANGNALQLAFAPMIGWPSIDVTATATAVFGSNALPWDLSIVQDVSGSFTNSLPTARAADQGLLGCMMTSAPANSRLGITIFGQTPSVYLNPIDVQTNTLPTTINNIPTCLNSPPPGSTTPSCNGTDIAAGINQTLSAYNGTPNPAGTSQRSMVIVTDGLPNTCGGTSCSQSTAQANAEAAADAAYAQGISIYTIYYCSSGNCSSSAQSWLSTMVRGSGIALVTPDPTKLATLMGQVCASQPHRLVW